MSDFVLINNSNDDIQRALDKAYSEQIGTVVIEKGVYELDNCLLLHDNIHLVLNGAKLVPSKNFKGEFLLANSNVTKDYGKTIEAEQYGITITANDGAEISGSILLASVRNCVIDGVTFSGVKNFGIVLVSTICVKVKNVIFRDCFNGIALGSGARDIIINNISGSVSNNLFEISDLLYKTKKKYYHTYDVMNNIISDVNVTAKNIAYIYGDKMEFVGYQAERIIFSNIYGKVSNYAFVVEVGKFIILDNVKVDGKVLLNLSKDQLTCIND